MVDKNQKKIYLTFSGRMVYLSLGGRLSEKLLGKTTTENVRRKEIFYKVTTFTLTYLTYFAYHIAKRPISIMEVIQLNNAVSTYKILLSCLLPQTSKTFLTCESFVNVSESVEDTWCSWAWIDQMSGVAQDTAEGKLHTMINLYTSFYAASLFISGIIAERYKSFRKCFQTKFPLNYGKLVSKKKIPRTFIEL